MILASAMLMLAVAAQRDDASVKGSRKDAELAMAEFAACEVRSDKGRAAALAFTREVAGTPSDYPKRLVRSLCARRGTTMRFNAELFRMSLFPVLYARDYGALTAPRGSSAGRISGAWRNTVADLRTSSALPCQPMLPGRMSNGTGQ